MEVFSIFSLFILGVSIGSFYSMLSFRAAVEEEIPLKKRLGFTGRSFCPNCKHLLSFFDLIPLLSFLLLRGRCRYCKEKISFFYPVMEGMMGLGFVLVYWSNWANWTNLTNWPNLIFILTIASVLVGIFVADLFFGIIPDVFLVLGLAGATIYNLYNNYNNYNHYNLYNFFEGVAAGFIAFLFFLAIYLLTKGRGIGFGDVKFAFLIGFILGPSFAFFAFWIAFVSGALASLILLLLRRKKIGDTIALGPFLAFGTFLMMFWGKEVVSLFCKAFMVCI